MTETSARPTDAATGPSDAKATAKGPEQAQTASVPDPAQAASIPGQAQGVGAPDQADSSAREVSDIRDKLLRALAEMENLRRRTQREVVDARQYAIAGF